MIKTTIRILFCFAVIFLFSCRQAKKINYLYNNQSAKYDSLYARSFETYKVQPNDVISVKIISSDEEVSKLYNLMGSSLGGSNTFAFGGFYVNGYPVSKDGLIELPFLGSVDVKNKTVDEIKNEVKLKADNYLKGAEIVVRLVSFYVTVLGEVKVPGQKLVYTDRLSILEGIGLAGDITYYGNRKEVMIIRTTPEGTYTFKVDVTNKDVLSSAKYYLAPNDIVYVRPRKMAVFKQQFTDLTLPITTVFSMLTTVLLILNLLK